jgi:UDP-N-acetyl-D-glucosamine dehydrogenase
MPYYVVEKVVDSLNDRGKPARGSKVLVLGVAYKENIDDVRESPALDVMKILADKGASVSYSDPHVPGIDEAGLKMASVELTSDSLAGFDCLVIATAHDTFDYDTIVGAGVPIVDTRNALKRYDAEHIRKI